VKLPAAPGAPMTGAASIAFVGSGNYATAVLIPAFKDAGARLKVVASSGGVTGVHAGRKFGFESTTTDTDGVFTDPDVQAIVLSTRHDTHADMACKALRAGKHVFVEKPLALKHEELGQIEQAIAEGTRNGRAPMVMVGFNRRFATQVQKVKSLLKGVTGPKSFIMTVNAGAIPAGGLLDVSDEKWRHAWDLKVFGFITLSREIYRRMCERQSGVIINVIGVAENYGSD
jgi:predicted dehydrogenase